MLIFYLFTFYGCKSGTIRVDKFHLVKKGRLAVLKSWIQTIMFSHKNKWFKDICNFKHYHNLFKHFLAVHNKILINYRAYQLRYNLYFLFQYIHKVVWAVQPHTCCRELEKLMLKMPISTCFSCVCLFILTTKHQLDRYFHISIINWCLISVVCVCVHVWMVGGVISGKV